MVKRINLDAFQVNYRSKDEDVGGLLPRIKTSSNRVSNWLFLVAFHM